MLICLFSCSTVFWFLIANDNTPYRDVRVYINDVLQDRHDGTNFALHVGDNMTIFVLAVGNVSGAISASEERFICDTGFPCNQQSHEVDDRYMECSLRSPANMSDDGRELRVVLDDMELTTITISSK